MTNNNCNGKHSSRINGACNIIDVSGEISIQNKIDLFDKAIFSQQHSFISKGNSSTFLSTPGLSSDQSSKVKPISDNSAEDQISKEVDSTSEFCLDMKMVYSLILERCKRVTYIENCKNENCTGTKLLLKNRDSTAADKDYFSESSLKQTSCLPSHGFKSTQAKNTSILHTAPKRDKQEIPKNNAPNDINELIEFINSETNQLKKEEQKKKDKKKKKKNTAIVNDTTLDKTQSTGPENVKETSQTELIKQQPSIAKKIFQGNGVSNSVFNKCNLEEDKEIDAFRAALKSMSVHSAFVYKLKTVLKKDSFNYICLSI